MTDSGPDGASAHETTHPLRPILRNWVWEHGHIGTRYLDCVDGAVKFDEGKKARFAEAKVFHVSLAKDADAAAHAAGPLIHDGGLARFLHAVQAGRSAEAGSVADVQRAVQDCIELGLVCAYQREARVLLARYAEEPMFEDEIRAAVIAEIRAKYVPYRQQLALFDFGVIHGLPAPMMITDAPLVDWRRAKPPQPFVTMPLAPGALLVGAPSGKKSRVDPVQWKTVNQMGPLKDHNRHVVESAHDWIVATSDDQLVAVQARFAPKPAAG